MFLNKSYMTNYNCILIVTTHGIEKSKVTAFYTNVFKQRCEVYLGGNLVEAADHCKRQKKWWSLLIQLLCNLK